MTSFSDDPLLNEDPANDVALDGVVDVGGVKPGDNMACLVKGMLRSIGENPEREGLLKTPFRVDQAMKWLTKGYSEKLEDVVNDAIFTSDNDDIVLVKDIDVFSMCEHHMLPFYGKAHIAYIPDGKVIGISKLPRIAEIFARRLQIQEQLTFQIAQAVEEVLQPRGVAVIIECAHMCMVMRGIQKVGSTTVTRSLTGAFKEEFQLRTELFKMIRGETM
ncbi:MAG: GTP cyclohydrolase I FolE [Planctomycetes bacterium]|nr:GTP cyclohydrolase I FolE [Planctomycetota bacterium]MCA8936383.1 GTP cyclohydrolase I FolE [Planctomycetota bacterium]MCA8945808.1 GTP cyclohydrolase I FolE [Planctomycetota bacterium]